MKFYFRDFNLLNKKTRTNPSLLANYQTVSAISYLLLLCLIILLASAMGIGAWKTHFLNWDATLNVLEMQKLLMQSIFSVLGGDASSSHWVNTLIVTTFALCAFLLMMLSIALLHGTQRKERSNSILSSSAVQLAVAVFALMIVEYGVPLNAWLIAGFAASLVLSNILLQAACKVDATTNTRAIACLGFLIVVINLVVAIMYFSQQQSLVVLSLATLLLVWHLLLNLNLVILLFSRVRANDPSTTLFSKNSEKDNEQSASQ